MTNPSYQNMLNRIAPKVLGMVHSYAPPRPHTVYTVDSDLISDCGFDSLDNIEVVMMLEDEFDIEITDDVCSGVSTIGDLVDVVMTQLIPPETWHNPPSTTPVAVSDDTPAEPQYVSMGVVSAMPGTDGGFTFACFVGREVPVGTEVFVRVYE